MLYVANSVSVIAFDRTMRVYLVNLLLLCFVGSHYASAEVCAGCPVEGSAQDKNVYDLLNKAVAKQNSKTNEEPITVEKITSVKTQVVAGLKSYIDFDAILKSSKKKVRCTTVLLQQAWISKEPQILDFKCTNPSKRSLPGGPIDVTIKESKQVRQLAEMGIETLDELDEDDNKRIITDVIRAMKKLVNGIMYDISVEVKTTSCKEKESGNEKCLSDEVGPLKICNLHIYRSFADKSPHNAKVVKSECFSAKKDRSLEDNFDSAEYRKRVADYAVKTINGAINSVVVIGLANILESDHMYDSGIHQTSMTLEVGDTNCTKQGPYDDSECLLLPGLENHMVCNVRVKHDIEKKKLDLDHNFSCKNIKKDLTLSNRAKRALHGGSSSLDLSDEKFNDFKTYITNEINQLSGVFMHRAVVKFISGMKPMSERITYRLLIEIAETSCLNGERKVEECSPPEEKRLICLLDVLDTPEGKMFTGHQCFSIAEALNTPLAAEILGVDADDRYFIRFKVFANKFERSYKTVDELRRRFRIFRANMKKADILQRNEQGTAKYGASMFSDLTSTEFQKNYLGLKKRTSDSKYKQEIAHIPNITLPEEYDWRNYNVVTPVKNQGLCGSCWAFSITGNIEGQYAIKTGNLLSLSEQELVDCDKYDSGCEGGLFDTAYHAIEDLGGLESESDYPYSGRDGKCHFDSSEVRVSITSSVNISNDETDMAKWLVANGPISIGINANAMQFYLGGVSHPLKFLCDPQTLDHGVLIVGYGIHQTRFLHKHLPYWLIKNSWGSHWGHKGYYMLYRGDGSCGVNQWPSSAVL